MLRQAEKFQQLNRETKAEAAERKQREEEERTRMEEQRRIEMEIQRQLELEEVIHITSYLCELFTQKKKRKTERLNELESQKQEREAERKKQQQKVGETTQQWTN